MCHWVAIDRNLFFFKLKLFKRQAQEILSNNPLDFDRLEDYSTIFTSPSVNNCKIERGLFCSRGEHTRPWQPLIFIFIFHENIHVPLRDRHGFQSLHILFGESRQETSIKWTLRSSVHQKAES